MSLKLTLATALVALGLATPLAAEIRVEDAYARSSSPVAQTGAAFMMVTNAGAADDRIIGAASDAAQRVELHTHIEDTNGVMRMVEIEDGIALPAGQTHMLQRGGDHVMLMGLTQPLEQGDSIEVTLTFEHAEPMTVIIPVDLERQPDHGMMQMDQPADG